MIVAGNKIYGTCRDCGKLVRANGFFAGWHVCLSPEERYFKRALRNQVNRQYSPMLGLGDLGGKPFPQQQQRTEISLTESKDAKP